MEVHTDVMENLDEVTHAIRSTVQPGDHAYQGDAASALEQSLWPKNRSYMQKCSHTWCYLRQLTVLHKYSMHAGVCQHKVDFDA